MKPFATFGAFFNVTDCNEWYMYEFNETTTTEKDRKYFGANNELPLTRPKSEGMLKGGLNILEVPCKEINRSVPYFIEGNQNETMNQQLFRKLEWLTKQDFNLKSKLETITGLEDVPDGMIQIQRSDEKNFEYRL